jgi:hypothetical protein
MTRARSDAIMAAYGLPGRRHEAYEIDLLIPLSIGESDDDEDLWPQPRRMIESEWTAERKDDLDAAAQPRVCWPDRDHGGPESHRRRLDEAWMRYVPFVFPW